MVVKPRPRFMIVWASLAAVLIMILSSCGATGTPVGQTPQGTTAAKPVKGGTFLDAYFEEPSSLIPNLSAETYSAMMDNVLYTPLFHTDNSGKIFPALATEVPTLENGGISADLKTWTIKIRPGVTWSDGVPTTAEDVDWSWKFWMDPKAGSASTVGFNQITSTDISADKMQITFHLKQGFAPFLASWVDGGSAPLPKHVFEKMPADQVLKSKDNLNPQVTNGSFKMSEAVPGDHYTVVRNDKYYRASEGLPYLDKIIFKITDSQDTILKEFQAGNPTGSWFLDVSKKPIYEKLPGYHVVVNPVNANYEIMIMNFKNPILGKFKEVRQAIAMAIDHQAMIKTARLGLASELCTTHPKAYNPGYQADAKCPKHDVDAANKLLDDNGWTKGADGVRVKDGQRLEFKYSTTANNKWRASDELIQQDAMKSIGIKLNIDNYPASTYFGKFLPEGKHDLAEFETGPGLDPDDSGLIGGDQFPPNGSNWTWYVNKQLDDLIKQEQQEADPAKRQAIFNQMHDIYLSDFPFVILYGVSDMAVVKNSVHNYLPGPYGASEFANAWMWWCDGGNCGTK